MRVVRMLHGWKWIREGAAIFGRSPIPWMMLVFSYWFAMRLIGALPIVGPVIGLLLIPGISASFMNIAREAGRDRPLSPTLLVSGFRSNASAIVTLGGLYLVAFSLVIGLATLFDGGELFRFLVLG